MKMAVVLGLLLWATPVWAEDIDFQAPGTDVSVPQKDTAMTPPDSQNTRPNGFKGREGGKGKKRGGMQKMMQALDLSDEQKLQIKEIRDASRGDGQNLKEMAKKAKEDFKAAMASGASDEVLKQKFSVMQDAVQAMKESRFDQMLKIRALLNDEQRKKFQELRQRHRGKREKGRKGRGGFKNQ